MRIEFSHSKIVSDQWIDRSLSEMGKNPNFRAYFANFVRVPPLLRSFKAGKFRKVKVCTRSLGLFAIKESRYPRATVDIFG
jgi:hypothetical protein